MTMATTPQIQANIQLAEQINDEFLTCKICFEHYKEPKSLSCLHTFCEECIEQVNNNKYNNSVFSKTFCVTL